MLNVYTGITVFTGAIMGPFFNTFDKLTMTSIFFFIIPFTFNGSIRFFLFFFFLTVLSSTAYDGVLTKKKKIQDADVYWPNREQNDTLNGGPWICPPYAPAAFPVHTPNIH